jgi:TRAP-type uncharacterized transport system fused permease subunit
MMHFVFPIILAIIVWKLRPQKYWQLVVSYLFVSFSGFLVFLLFPAAPTWMASDMGLIEPIRRISSDIWWSLGIHDFPSVYNQISPNAVAAVPSLHAAYATLFALYITTLFKSRTRFLAGACEPYFDTTPMDPSNPAWCQKEFPKPKPRKKILPENVGTN